MFKELTIMKSTWGLKLYNAATCNAAQVEEVSLLDFEQMLVDDVDVAEWGKDDEGDFELQLVESD